jgi:hypothetical protein
MARLIGTTVTTVQPVVLPMRTDAVPQVSSHSFCNQGFTLLHPPLFAYKQLRLDLVEECLQSDFVC